MGSGEENSSPLRLLLLSEDSAASSLPTLKLFLKSMFQELVPQIEFHRIQFEPLEPELRRVLSGNVWKSKSRWDQDSIIDLRRAIANHLRRSNACVIFHCDGDVAYGDREHSENVKKFNELIVKPVSDLLQITPSQLRASKQAASLQISPEASLANLILFVPYYCIEAWCYYNNSALRSIADESDLPTIGKWAEQPELIEEVIRPFEAVPSVGKRHNLSLAGSGFSVADAAAIQKSFADAMNLLKSKVTLMNSLTRLRSPWLSPTS